jgi:hypothetical protein
MEARDACLQPGPWLVLKDRGPKIGFRLLSIGSLRLGRAPEPQRQGACSGLAQSLAESCSPRAPG